MWLLSRYCIILSVLDSIEVILQIIPKPSIIIYNYIVKVESGCRKDLLQLRGSLIDSSLPQLQNQQAKKIWLYDKKISYFLAKKGRWESGGIAGLEASTLFEQGQGLLGLDTSILKLNKKAIIIQYLVIRQKSKCIKSVKIHFLSTQIDLLKHGLYSPKTNRSNMDFSKSLIPLTHYFDFPYLITLHFFLKVSSSSTTCLIPWLHQSCEDTHFCQRVSLRLEEWRSAFLSFARAVSDPLHGKTPKLALLQ